MGTFVSVLARASGGGEQLMGTSGVLMWNASDVEGVYVGLQLKIVGGKEIDQICDITAYNATARMVSVIFKEGVQPDNSSVYQITCGVKKTAVSVLKSHSGRGSRTLSCACNAGCILGQREYGA